MHSEMYANDFWETPKSSARVHSGDPNQMPPKYWMKYVSEGALPLFSYVFYPRECGGYN